MEKEDKFLLSLVEDKMRQCDTKNIPTSTFFLDMRQQSLVETHCRTFSCRFELLGGYPDAERRVCVFLPEYADESMFDGLSCIRVQTATALPKPLTHRDYLGSLMAMGIKRETVGDILVRPDGADFFVLSEIRDFLLSEYGGAGHARFTAREIPQDALLLPQVETVTVRDTVPSLRLDCVASTAFSLSRGNLCAFIEGGRLFVNGIQILKKDHKVSEGDILVLRGKGKAVLRTVGGRSKKDRIFIEIEKYK